MPIITIGMAPIENGWIWSFQFSFRDMPTNFKIFEVVVSYLDIIHISLVFIFSSNTWD
jgi:hypothetical protein